MASQLAAPGSAGSLKRALRIRHLVTLSVGGTIASGFFLATGGAISAAGPGVIITYLIGGIVIIGVQACVAELAVQGETGAGSAGGFAIYAQRRLGPWFGFMTGWNYWLAWVGGIAAEAVAVGIYVNSLAPFHAYPVWLISIVVVTLDLAVNLLDVLTMGNYEFILSSIKIIAIVVFVVACLAAVLGVGTSPVGFGNLTAHGGFLPLGVSGLFASFLLVFYAYTGVEMINIGAEESVRPEHDVPVALLGTAALVMALFIFAILGLVIVEPWTLLGTSSAPLTDALNAVGYKAVATLITFAIILSSISCIDSGIYASSRMLFALAREGYFPSRFSKTHATRRVPIAAITVCGACIYGGAILDYLSPNYAFVFLGSLATLGFMWAYVLIPVLEILYRRGLTPEETATLHWRVPFWPWTPIVCAAFILIAVVGPIFTTSPGLLGIPSGALPVVAGVVWVAFWSVYYVTLGRYYRQQASSEALESLAEV